MSKIKTDIRAYICYGRTAIGVPSLDGKPPGRCAYNQLGYKGGGEVKRWLIPGYIGADCFLVCLMVLVIALAGATTARAESEGLKAACPPATEETAECMSFEIPEGASFEAGGERGGLDPENLRSAYKLPEKGGSGQTVAIVDAYNDPNAESDLKAYRSHYGLSECTTVNGCFEKVNQKGESSKYPENNRNWSGEISLDLDMVSAICSECHILLVEATTNSYVNLEAAENEAATLKSTEISDSWGGPEFSSETLGNSAFEHPGIPIVVAAGDHCYVNDCERYSTPSFPAVTPSVIAVGGTELKKESNSRGWTEEVWFEPKVEIENKIVELGTGSGCSFFESKPSWQTDKGCANRTDNDVAAVGACKTPLSIYDSYEREGWTLQCGTSAGTPIIAGVEGLSSRGAREAGAEAIWKLGAKGKLFDVTKGTNYSQLFGSCGSYLCEAEVGYDGPTGWGTPDGFFTSLPTATTGSTSGISRTEATVHGTVNPEGAETKYYFEYGTTEAYGSKTAEVDAGSGLGNLEVNKIITGLTAGTKYYYRIVAMNSNGTIYGTGQTFTTTSPSWSLKELASPKRMIGIGFWEPTCTSSTSCMAFGAYANNSGTTVPLVEAWNGSAWSAQEPSSPTGAKTANVQDGSCVSSVDCLAVGDFENSSGKEVPLAEIWNGTTWSVQEPPSPAGAKASTLNKVSCTSSTLCVAVGEFTNSSGKQLALAETWNGTSWSIQEPPSPSGAKAAYLASVSCTSSTSCIAVGNFNNSSSIWMPLVEKWNGTTWAAQEPPLPAGGKHGLLSRVSCASSTMCSAVGGFENSSGKNVPMAEKWNGTTWTGQELPTPAGAKSGMTWGVSCASSTECIGVGEYENSSGTKVTLGEKWNGTTWTVQEPQIPTGAKSSLLGGVSCVSSTACVAVGSFNNAAGIGSALSETWNGTAWTIQEFASPIGMMKDTGLSALTCMSSTECIAVGAFSKTNGDRSPMEETWNGATWSVLEPPRPTGARAGTLRGTWCGSSTNCIAVGEFENSSGKKESWSETWNGTSWSIQEPPNPSGFKSSVLYGVSCTSSTSCIAVGEFENSSGTHVALAEAWNGTAWSIQEPQIPTGANASALYSLSCASSTSCIAVGVINNSSGVWTTLSEKWNGTTWSSQEPPRPAGALAADTFGVSCTSSTECVAVGWFENSSKARMPLAEKWNGTSWSAQEPPIPTGAKSGTLDSVQCVSSTECTVVGNYANSSGTEVALSEKWNGAAWSIQEPQIPAGAKASNLGAVACTSGTKCVAVGSFGSGSSGEIAFAELYQ